MPTFTALAALLPQVASDPYACIIRGALLPGVDRPAAGACATGPCTATR